MLAVSYVAVAATGAILTAPLDRNEHMYMAAASLVDGHDMYRDFAFLQAPYLPDLYSALARLFHASDVLLLGRIVSATSYLVFMAATFWLSMRFSASRLDGALLGLTAATNSVALRPFLEASNYASSYALSLLATALSHRAVVTTSRRSTALAAGLTLGLAIGIKSYCILLLGPLLFHTAAAGPRHEQAREAAKIWPYLLAGAGLSLLPCLLVAARAWSGFWFGNVEFHVFNERWRRSMGFQHAMDPVGKATKFIAASLESPGIVVLSLSAVASLLMRNNRRRGATPLGGLLAVTCGAAVAAVIPTPTMPQHFGYVIPFVALLAGAHAVQKMPSPWGRAVLMASAVTSLWFSPLRDVAHTQAFTSPDRWASTNVRRAGIAISRALHLSGASGPVATLFPAYPTAAHVPIYPELATGVFAYRVGDLVPPGRQATLLITSPSHVARVLRLTPPAAILIGFDEALERPLVNFAIQKGYVVQRDYPGPGRLFVGTPNNRN